MRPIFAIVASAVGFAVTCWVVRNALRFIFRGQAQNPLGVALISAGVWLLFVRAFMLAVPLLVLGIILSLRNNVALSNGSTTRVSTVRSAHLEMFLDHESGTIDGRILTGEHEGQALSSLSLTDLLSYHAELQSDQDSVLLLETYLDSAQPDWRDQMDGNSSTHDDDKSPLSRQLSRDEAYQLLGLEAGCSDEDIRRAYHRLIKRVHPDGGGSAALTTRVTEARDRLFGDRH